MFMGIVLHAGISFMTKPLPFWPVIDERSTVLADLLLVNIHHFRMQLFFLIAGFFGALLYARNGAWGTATHRLKRIAIPLGLATLTLQPLLQAISIYAGATAYRDGSLRAGVPPALLAILSTGDTAWDATREHFIRGTVWDYVRPIHLWFLWYLLIFFALMLPLASLADRWTRGRTTQWDRGWRWLFAASGRWVVLPAIAWLLLLPMQGPAGPDTPLFWTPKLSLIAYYFFFFATGWTLFRHRDVLPAFLRPWRAALLWGTCVFFPGAVVGLVLSGEMKAEQPVLAETLHMLADASASVFCWCMIVGLIGLFEYVFAQPKAWVRWSADASYWCYVASLPPIVWMQFLVRDWPLLAEVKFLLVTLLSTLLLVISYQLCVRYTWLGRMLNGPRTRTQVTPSATNP